MNKKEIFNLVWAGWSHFWGAFMLCFWVCLFLFGGKYSWEINFHSWIDLWNVIFKKK